jgi:hypothetical protein
MKRVTLVSLVALSLLLSAPVAFADGYSPEGDSQAPSAADAANSSKQLDKNANSPRASMDEAAMLGQVGEEEKAAAVGHYARARSLLIAALREFDQGYKLAKPDAIIDSKQWRDDLISRAEDLERVLAPQARASKFGVKYDADPRLLGADSEAK